VSHGPDPNDHKPQRQGLESFREYSPYLTLGFQLAAAVVVFLMIGVWLDDRWNTSPWLKLAGLFVGTVGGFIKFFTTVSRLGKEQGKKT
jgi:F0F1-type ATP synthase assembly protein I